ncbi:MAG: ParB/RepB/Spo0J family partition protein [Fibromonadaceae bacterium]|jgi:ParB family chromosome partitioning protein|nr:ParB/RepB/Spo0J family partition protein [Fibromonadaceae bacterium]
MGKKSMGLGRSMGDIIRDHSIDTSKLGQEGENYASKISLEVIDANPYQPRKFFDKEALRELADSIKLHGLLEPILLRKHADRYQIISGERRVRAARLAGLKKIEARVFDLLSDKTMAEWAIIENIQREDLDQIEIAASYQELLNSHGYTHDVLADRLGKSRTTVTNSLRLLRLPSQVQKWIQEGKLSAGTARSLLSPNISDPEKAAKEIIEKGLSAREAEVLAQGKKKDKGSKYAKNSKNSADPDMQKFLDSLQKAFGIKVICKSSKKNPQKGTLIINYSSYDDLTRIQQAVSSV